VKSILAFLCPICRAMHGGLRPTFCSAR